MASLLKRQGPRVYVSDESILGEAKQGQGSPTRQGHVAKGYVATRGRVRVAAAARRLSGNLSWSCLKTRTGLPAPPTPLQLQPWGNLALIIAPAAPWNPFTQIIHGQPGRGS